MSAFEPAEAEIVSPRTALLARVAYVAVIVIGTMTRLEADFDPTRILRRLARALTPALHARDAVDALRNLAMFAGFGAVWLITARGRRSTVHVRDAMLAGAAIGALVETIQLVSPVRFSSILDVLTNALGAGAGALVVVLFVASTRAARGRWSFVGLPAFVFGFSYAGAAMLEAFGPLLRQWTIRDAWGGPVRRWHVAMREFDPRSLYDIPRLDALLFLPAGFFVVATLLERGRSPRAAFWLTVGPAAVLLVAVEVSHAPAGELVALGAIVAHVAGVAVGALVGAASLPRLVRAAPAATRTRAKAVVAAYSLVLALWTWRPFVLDLHDYSIRAQLDPRRFIPLRALVERVSLFSVTEVGVQFLLYVPLGAMLAVWPIRRRGPLADLLPALYLSALLEAGQIFIAGRYFDATDILIQCAAASVGWAVARRVGLRPLGELVP